MLDHLQGRGVGCGLLMLTLAGGSLPKKAAMGPPHSVEMEDWSLALGL